MKKTFTFFLLSCFCLFIFGELIGRYYGLTSFPLFIADSDFEYISAPNQNVYIYRNHFVTNQYSQRSEFYYKSDTIVYLLIGDSVVYGGNLIDQDSLASTILEDKLQRKTGKSVRVLNISARTWGPDNAAAYIRKYSTFSADKIILVVSSHDAHDNMTFKPVVGIDDAYPVQNTKWIWPKLLSKGWFTISEKLKGVFINTKVSEVNQNGPFNSGFDSFRKLTDSLHIPLTVYLHKTTNEIYAGKLDKGGKEIQLYCNKHRIRLLETNETSDLYQDDIHFNKRGQRFLSKKLYPILSE